MTPLANTTPPSAPRGALARRSLPHRALARLLFVAAMLASSAPAQEPQTRGPYLSFGDGGQYVTVPKSVDEKRVGRLAWHFTRSGVPVAHDRAYLLPHGEPGQETAYVHWCLGPFHPREATSAAPPPDPAGFQRKADGGVEAFQLDHPTAARRQSVAVAEVERYLRAGVGPAPASVDAEEFYRDLFLQFQESLRERREAENPTAQAGWFDLYELVELDEEGADGWNVVAVIPCATLEELEAKRAEATRALAAAFERGEWKAPADFDIPAFAQRAYVHGQMRLAARHMSRPASEIAPFLKPSGRIFSLHGGIAILSWDKYEEWVEKEVVSLMADFESGALPLPAGVSARAAAEWRLHWSQLSRWRPETPTAAPVPTPAPYSPPSPFAGPPHGSASFGSAPFGTAPAATSAASSASSSPFTSAPGPNPFAAPPAGSASPFGSAGVPFNPFGGGPTGATSPFGSAMTAIPTPAPAPTPAPTGPPPPTREEILDSFAAAMARRALALDGEATARYIVGEWLRARGASDMADVLRELYGGLPSSRAPSAGAVSPLADSASPAP